MKKFLRDVAFFSTPLLIVLLMTNFFGDAGNLFSNIESQVATYMLSGKDVSNTSSLNERVLQYNIINAYQKSPEVIVLGSSRVMLVGKAYSNSTLMNHSVSRCLLEDMIGIYQIFKNNQVFPNKILIGMDPWIFNGTNSQGKYLTLKSDYESFMNKKNRKPIIDWWKYRQLVSFSYWQVSINMLIKRIFGKNKIKPTDIIHRNKLTHQSRLADGTIRYSKSFRETSIKEVEFKAKDYIFGDVYFIRRI
jgi:hypothetical protein